jgi:hypothetical protein
MGANPDKVELPVRDVMGRPEDILSEAHELVRGERLKFYGPPTKNFRRIAGQWTAYLGIDDQLEDVQSVLAALGDLVDLEDPKVHAAFHAVVEALDSVNAEVTSDDVCCLMILLKVSRIRTGGSYHRDSAVDAAGYAALLEILHDAEV